MAQLIRSLYFLSLVISSAKSFQSHRVATSPNPAAVLEYWFGGEPNTNFKEKWFTRPASSHQTSADAKINLMFGHYVRAAEECRLDFWEESPSDMLALIIVLDQFSRHVHRSHPERVSHNDAIALSKANLLLQKGWDNEVC